jgi:general L-amino acid transport system permease protein
LSTTTATGRPAPWRDVRVLRWVAQAAFLAATLAVVWWLRSNLISNLRRQGLRTDFGYLDQPAGFRIPGSAFSSGQPVSEALVVGLKNTALVAVAGIVLASVLGLIVGVARLSSNWLVRRAASLYVESLRNVPVLVIIIFWSLAVILKLPRVEWGDAVVLSNRGLWLPWLRAQAGAGAFRWVVVAAFGMALAVAWWRRRRFEATGQPPRRILWAAGALALVTAAGYGVLGGPVGLTLPELDGPAVRGGLRLEPEYTALLLGLVVYTASHIAEIVRASILAVPRGQSEAAEALGLSSGQRLRLVVLPQALRVMIPPLANQYLNLSKNSSLGVAIGYAEITSVTNILIGNGQPAPQSIAVMMGIYLVFSLAIAAVTNLAGRRLAVPTR